MPHPPVRPPVVPARRPEPSSLDRQVSEEWTGAPHERPRLPGPPGRQPGLRETAPVKGFDGVAHAGVAMVTCMDSRIDPLRMVGLKPGDAKIFRNPGGRVDDAALEALVLGVHLLGVNRILVVPAHPLRRGLQHRRRAARAGQRLRPEGRDLVPLPRRRGPGGGAAPRRAQGPHASPDPRRTSRSAASSTTSTRACSARSSEPDGPRPTAGSTPSTTSRAQVSKSRHRHRRCRRHPRVVAARCRSRCRSGPPSGCPNRTRGAPGRRPAPAA